MISAALLMLIGLLAGLGVLVYGASSAVSSARETMAPRFTELVNITMTSARSTERAINSMRGTSQNVEYFSDIGLANLRNATEHVHALAEHLDRSLHQPIGLSLSG